MKSLTASQLRQLYLDFFRDRGHAIIPSSSLVPENDPTVLFTTAGMHPLVPFLLGQSHPLGKRLTSVQKCLRTVDIEKVGDASHLTFFEMLGNWSLGDYFKKEAITWSFEFLTKVLEIPVNKLSVTCFAGGEAAPRDEEAAMFWEGLGIPKDRIFFLDKEHNWWGPAGQTGPCGPSSEMFVDIGGPPCGPDCDPACSCGKYLEIWNDVFMEYAKTANGEYRPLEQKNIDTGMGLERTLAIVNGVSDVFEIELLSPLISSLEEISGLSYTSSPKTKRAMRIIADHVRSATFILADGVLPSNKERGYVLRRLIRRAMVKGRDLGLEAPEGFSQKLVDVVIEGLGGAYPELREKQAFIKEEMSTEERHFRKTLERGLRELKDLLVKSNFKSFSGSDAFYLYQTYGFPWELIQENVRQYGIELDRRDFDKAQASHQEKSRVGARRKFAGGLVDHSEITTKYHTATHLLQAALRQVLGSHIQQKGSNITQERLRFDFCHDGRLSEEELSQVESLVNQAIAEDLPISVEVLSLDQARQQGALAFFDQKYGDKVTVYTIGDPAAPFSREICGGPHVERTGDLGNFRIIKQESVGRGVRRIKAVLQ